VFAEKFSKSSYSCRRVDSLAMAAVLCGSLILCGFAHAQYTPETKQFDNPGPQQIASAVQALSKQSQDNVDKLSKLDELPAPGWKYHVGYVAGAQEPSFDDSSWPAANASGSVHTQEILWVRGTVTVPQSLNGYDLTGTKLWIQGWRPEEYALTLFINGDRAGEGEGLMPQVLAKNIKPGDKIFVAIELRVSARPKRVPLTRIRIDFIPSRPSPRDLYNEIIASTLLVPQFAKNDPSKTAALDKAVKDIDFKSLDAGDQKAFDASLRKLQQDLEVLKPVVKQATYHITGNSHIDAAWLWPWSETVDVVRRTFGSALHLMNEYPSYTYTQSAAQYNEWMADKYPEINNQIKKRIQEGRWELVGGMWVEPDLNMPDGESQVRQLLIGQRSFKEMYGATASIGWNPDTFGYNWQLPQIYKKSGINYFVTQKMVFNETNPLPFKLFWWESPDGSKILTYFPHGYANNKMTPLRMTNDFVQERTLAPGLTEMMDLYGVGDHGGGATRMVLDEATHWEQPGKIAPKIEWGFAKTYFSDVENKISPVSPTWNYQAMGKGVAALPQPEAGKISIPTWNDELYFEHHRGTLTTQAAHKRNMRESEEWVLNAEKYSSFAWLDGGKYPAAELNEAWKKVLFNQFHDLAAGSGIGVLYKEAQKDYDQVRWATNEASSKALNTIQGRIHTKLAGQVPVVVFNPLGWNRSGVVPVDIEMPTSEGDGVTVLDRAGRVVPSQVVSRNKATNTYHLLIQAKDIPSLGYEVLHVVPGRRTFVTDLKANGTVLENANLKVSVDQSTGCITSLYNKKDNFEALSKGACGNELQAFKDTPVDDDAWNIDPGTLDHVIPLTKADSVKLVENTPFRAVVRVERTWQSSKFVQDITLYANSDQVEVVNDIDWHENHILLKAAFPLAASSNMATYEIPYGTIQRPTTRNNTWDAAKFEVPAMRWADLGDGKHGFSLINESKYGYDGKDNVLRLTLLRSPLAPDPEADRGHQHFSFALYPHAADWKAALTVRHGYEYNYKLQALQVQAHTGSLPLTHSFIEVDSKNVVLTAVKKAEDENGLILHFYEWAGQSGKVEFRIPAGAKSATLTNLMEKPEGSPIPVVDTNKVGVSVTPYSITSLRVDYPDAQKQ